MYGICNLSIIPCRAQPFDKSEMVTQLLFGEHFKILVEEEKWALIKIAYDGYECWIDKKQFKRISEEEYNFLNNEPQHLSMEILTNSKSKVSNSKFQILLGSVLPNLKKRKFKIGGEEFYFRGKTTGNKSAPNAFGDGLRHSAEKRATRNRIISTSKIYLNSPYLWGGRSPLGIDCSGFTQMVFKLNGIKLPRDAYQQAEIGETLNFIEEAQKGDLAFFDNEEGKIIHTGIISDKAQIIHAYGKVRIDNLDHYGIFNTETGKYSHNLRLIKRII